tara:strand:- start:1389 stop:1598 length:210 start_codon:yes stop_codon:yes gene_type:complete
MNRFDFVHKQYREKKERARRERLIGSNRPAVEVNGNGTSGYRFKEGSNAGKVAGHLNVDHPNKTYKDYR